MLLEPKAAAVTEKSVVQVLPAQPCEAANASQAAHVAQAVALLSGLVAVSSVLVGASLLGQLGRSR